MNLFDVDSLFIRGKRYDDPRLDIFNAVFYYWTMGTNGAKLHSTSIHTRQFTATFINGVRMELCK
ncbi:MAG: hypothetical protein ACRCXZ_10135 [Patescibacteria group bacterium]